MFLSYLMKICCENSREYSWKNVKAASHLNNGEAAFTFKNKFLKNYFEKNGNVL